MPVASITVAVSGSAKEKAIRPLFLPGEFASRTESPPSLSPEMEACSPSPFWNRKYAGILTSSRTDRRRSRFRRARAARKLDFAFSVEIGLETTKFAPSLKAVCKLVRAATNTTATDLRFLRPHRTPFHRHTS